MINSTIIANGFNAEKHLFAISEMTQKHILVFPSLKLIKKWIMIHWSITLLIHWWQKKNVCPRSINIIQDSLYLHVDCWCTAERKDHTGGKQPIPRCYIMNTASLWFLRFFCFYNIFMRICFVFFFIGPPRWFSQVFIMFLGMQCSH